MNYESFINPELLILIPVLYFIGKAIKKSDIKDKHIPLILGLVSVVLCILYILSTSPLNGSQEIATALFMAFTQGVLIAGASVYTNELIKQESKEE